MELPFEIKNYIENELNNINLKSLQKNAKQISQNYRNNLRDGKKMLSKEEEAIAYAITRMPATFGAVAKSLEKTLEIYKSPIKSIADIGAGTGTASIAINELIDVDKIECFEREKAMIETGKKIFKHYNNLESKAIWKNLDITKDIIEDNYDLVVASYMINELKEEQINDVINKIWNISNKMILIVEPGTMQGYHNIMKAKEILVNLGGKIIAPCMSKICNLEKDDWCNFYCRVQRTKIHKNLKEGDSPFEDEKFIYIAISKDEVPNEYEARIIRHPLVYNGYIKLKVCKPNEIKELTITKKDKELFKRVKKLNHGDLI